MQIDRQSLIYGAIGAGVVILAVLAYVLSSSGNSQTGSGGNANIAEAGEIEGDMVMGDPNAPVTVIEYASMTCGHCAAFHTQTFPELKKKLYRHRQGKTDLSRISARRLGHRGLYARTMRK